MAGFTAGHTHHTPYSIHHTPHYINYDNDAIDWWIDNENMSNENLAIKQCSINLVQSKAAKASVSYGHENFSFYIYIHMYAFDGYRIIERLVNIQLLKIDC